MSPRETDNIPYRCWPRFTNRLAHWTFHCGLDALPSFAIASFQFGLMNNPDAPMAMLSGVATFVLLSSLLTSPRPARCALELSSVPGYPPSRSSP